MEEHVFDTVDIIIDDIDTYIEERRWDETTNGGEARDKNFDLVMARSIRLILPIIENVEIMRKNPSLLRRFKESPRKVVVEIVSLFGILFVVFYTIVTVIGLNEILMAALP